MHRYMSDFCEHSENLNKKSDKIFASAPTGTNLVIFYAENESCFETVEKSIQRKLQVDILKVNKDMRQSSILGCLMILEIYKKYPCSSYISRDVNNN